MSRRLVILGIILGIIFTWQAPLLAILVTEAAPTEPYEVVGHIEVEVDPLTLHPVEDCITILTFGLVRWPKGHFIKEKLINKLKDKAKLYSADAVMNVRFFPDPSKSSYLRDGKYIGKGELISYKRSF